jgi:hypothetical protein
MKEQQKIEAKDVAPLDLRHKQTPPVPLESLPPESPPDKFYSATTQGFYSSDIHSTEQIPADAVKITHDHWQQLLSAQALGMQIVPDTRGHPVNSGPSFEERAGRLRARRNRALAETDGLVARHRDELEIAKDRSLFQKVISRPTTLSAPAYAELQQWRQALRDLSQVSGFPDIELPAAPKGT